MSDAVVDADSAADALIADADVDIRIANTHAAAAARIAGMNAEDSDEDADAEEDDADAYEELLIANAEANADAYEKLRIARADDATRIARTNMMALIALHHNRMLLCAPRRLSFSD